MKDIQLFQALITYKKSSKDGDPVSFTLNNCVNIQGRLGQLYNGRIRPIILLININPTIFENLVAELRKSHGMINRHNYKVFLPHMAKLGFENDILVSILRTK